MNTSGITFLTKAQMWLILFHNRIPTWKPGEKQNTGDNFETKD